MALNRLRAMSDSMRVVSPGVIDKEGQNRSHVPCIDIFVGYGLPFFVLLIGKSPRIAKRHNTHLGMIWNWQDYRPIVMIHTSLHVASKMIPPGVASLEPPLVSNPCCSNSYPLELHSNMQCVIKTLELRTKISYIHKANQWWYSDLRELRCLSIIWFSQHWFIGRIADKAQLIR